jgi:hypothetical protein
MQSKSLLAALALSFAGGLPTAALAVDDILEMNRLSAPKSQWLSATEVAEKLRAKGYNVTEIEVNDGAYEVEMTDKSGTRIDAHVHPSTGEVLTGYDD